MLAATAWLDFRISSSAAVMSVRALMDDIPSRVLVEKMTTVDVRQVGGRLGTVSADEHVEIDQALRLVLGMR